MQALGKQRTLWCSSHKWEQQQQSQLSSEPQQLPVLTRSFDTLRWPVLLQASRRLMRRIRATLRKPGDNLGHVKVAVHTYAYLLAMSADENSSYGPTFFLKELLTGPDAVVGAALRT